MPNKLDLHALVKSTGVNPPTLETRFATTGIHPSMPTHYAVWTDLTDSLRPRANATNSAVCPFICCKTHRGSLPAVQYAKGDNRS
jgi:hypothetical protein